MLALLAFFFITFSLAMLGVTIWSVVEIATKPFKDKDSKVLWMIIVLALGIIGPLIYLAKRKELLADPLNDREYLPPLEDLEKRARPQVRGNYDDDQYV